MGFLDCLTCTSEGLSRVLAALQRKETQQKTVSKVRSWQSGTYLAGGIPDWEAKADKITTPTVAGQQQMQPKAVNGNLVHWSQPQGITPQLIMRGYIDD